MSTKSFNVSIQFNAKLVITEEAIAALELDLAEALQAADEAEDGPAKTRCLAGLNAFKGRSGEELAVAVSRNALRHSVREEVLSAIRQLSTKEMSIGKVSPFTVEVTPRGN